MSRHSRVFSTQVSSHIIYIVTLECDPGRVLTSSEGTSKYNEDWLGTVRGASSCVLRPRDTREVSSILAHCASRQLAICPQVLVTKLVTFVTAASISLGR